jgi:hypothetical protein
MEALKLLVLLLVSFASAQDYLKELKKSGFFWLTPRGLDSYITM